MTSRHLISTTATTSTCPRCQTTVLTALDEGLTATVDHTPTSTNHEIAVLLTNRRTYTRTPGGQLIHRTAERIRGGWLRGTIHAEHICTKQTQLTIDNLIGKTK